MTGEKKPPIIKKIIKKGHGGHHGGSWKVAYADFVTALMAFFLVMWLLAISSEAGREALADYYNELTLSDAIFNGGVPSAWEPGARPSILEGGCFSPTGRGEATVISEAEVGDVSTGQLAALLESTQQLLENLESLPEGVDGGEGSGDMGRGDAPTLPMNQGDQEFSEALHQDIEGSLGDAEAGQVLVERVRGGLRIQILDPEGRPLFRSGGAGLTGEGKKLIEVVSRRLAGLPNKISIEGHTDARPFTGGSITNWELSTARASAVRMALSGAGVAESRVVSVTGYAATRPLPDTNPNDPKNRRVSLMIWDEDKPASAGGGALLPKGPPSLPKTRNGRQRPRETKPPVLTPEQREQQLIDSVMERSATPDLSTVGPASSPPSDEDY